MNVVEVGLPPLPKDMKVLVLRHISQYNLQEKSFPFPAPLYDHKLKGKVKDGRDPVLFH